MAGIISSESSTKNAPGFIRDALIAGAVRGRDASGLLQIDPAVNLITHKLPLNGSMFLDDDTTDEIITDSETAWATFTHNRAATTGGKTLVAAQPMTMYSTHGGPNFALLHNGTLTSWSSQVGAKKFVSDTAFAARQIYDKGAEAIKDLKGAYCFVWVDQDRDTEGTINIIRNKERPLHMGWVKNKNTVLFASEAHMLFWLAQRNDFELEHSTVALLEEDQLYSFPVKAPKRFTKTPIKQVTVAPASTALVGQLLPPVAQTTTVNTSGSGNYASYKKNSIVKAIKEAYDASAAPAVTLPAGSTTGPASSPITHLTHGGAVPVEQGTVGNGRGRLELPRATTGDVGGSGSSTVVPFPKPKLTAANISLAREMGVLGNEVKFEPVCWDEDANEYLGEIEGKTKAYTGCIISVGTYAKELERAASADCYVLGARIRPPMSGRVYNEEPVDEIELILSRPFIVTTTSGAQIHYQTNRRKESVATG